MEQELQTARVLGHPTTKGDASENVWLELLKDYLPKRYQAAKAHVVDSNGAFSDQLDIVVFDRQYSPFILTFRDQLVIPAESVYAVFEAKQSINAAQVAYAREKVASVRRLHRTSLPIPHAGGTYPAKVPGHIIGGLVTLASDWSPAMGTPLLDALEGGGDDRLDIGCVARAGLFGIEADGTLNLTPNPKATTAFLMELIARLQQCATVPMVDIRAYARWLSGDRPT